MKSLLVVGQGAWGKKVAGSIQSHLEEHKVSSWSSRSFLLTPPTNKFDAIWIAGLPSNQVKALEIASLLSNLIILEKPICHTLEDFFNLEGVITNSHVNIDLSRPWNFSNLWVNTLQAIESWDLNRTEITFSRKGPAAHSYISSVEDWVPHDIYLASALFPSFEQEVSVNFMKSSSASLNTSLKLQSGAILNFTFAEHQERESFVKIQSTYGDLILDFVRRTLEINGEKGPIKNLNSLDDISRNYLSAFESNNRDTMKQIRTQRWFKSLIVQAN